MEVKHTYAITHIEADKLSDVQQQPIEPFRDLLLKYVEDTTNKIKPYVKLKIIKDSTNSRTTAILNILETNYSKPLRYIKTETFS